MPWGDRKKNAGLWFARGISTQANTMYFCTNYRKGVHIFLPLCLLRLASGGFVNISLEFFKKERGGLSPTRWSGVGEQR